MLASYKNGNTDVTILEDGTKIREYEGIPEVVHPESVDVKITGYCDMGCGYCHEGATVDGEHADIDRLLDVISDLPAGVELAVGGGNPLSHRGLLKFLSGAKTQGKIINITINQGHLGPYWSLVEYIIRQNLVNGVGVSITSKNKKYLRKLNDLTDNVVYHVIAGINEIGIMDDLISIGKNCKVLVLGYKQFGFGVKYYSDQVEEGIKEWYMYLPKYVGKCLISFDNLAIEQLNVKRLFTEQGWEKFYMGDDFCFSMYIDAVKQEYAPTSRSDDRVSFDDYSVKEYFNRFKNIYGKI